MFFVCGPARSGTSLLSTLLNSHPSVGCAQDTALFSSLKSAYSQIVVDNMPNMQITNNLKAEDFSRDLISLSSYLDFSLAPFKPEILSQATSAPIADLLSSQSVSGKILGQTFSTLSKYFFVDFQIDDPRKDRALGFEYLKCLDWENLMGGANYRQLSESFCRKFVKNFYPNKDIELLGEKTPSNLASLDVIDSMHPDSPKIVVIRNPIAIWGSKKERFLDRGMSAEGFAQSIAHLTPSFNKVSRQKVIFVRYEDLIVDCLGELNKIFDFLGVAPLSSQDELLKNSGSYTSYVGSSINSERNDHNLSLVEASEREILENICSGYLETFGYK